MKVTKQLVIYIDDEFLNIIDSYVKQEHIFCNSVIIKEDLT